MAKVQGAIEVDRDSCKGCSLCVEACPTNVIRLADEVNSKGYNFAYMHDPDACNGCTNCAMVCPDSCLTVYRVRLADAV
ncbi:4Fe-4S dicluster domain-containing protein [Xiashengella succiniciproducens]|jgi:2-oxoglutarate ferredoxin oxidoreductase subunit delta|uniref:4Fe-4S binding protein n=1 Tax=Xiashengella succiniciproducens TaxID=2949635 RepID=A0A9J6ZND8_9BACT|nr:4Fe-4S binding protein [Alkaliflexus sp. Ai-910]MDI9538920.1 4Fe-4S binding protein [Bacteroidota bacterium]URW79229.1 4Fe-4S binding protein [Alkaliflexus sp. Ai-910]HHT99944.1 4Fe-4S binding protein [Bacteroidales bacterium]